MSQMIKYIRMGSPEYTTQDFTPEVLHPLDRVKVILEQLIYIKYVSSVTNIDPVDVNKMKLNLSASLTTLPQTAITENVFDPINVLYRRGKEIASTLLNGLNLYANEYFTLIDIFNTSSKREYHNREYTATINAKFIDEIFAIYYGFINEDKYPKKVIPNAQLYLPSLSTKLNYNPALSTEENKDYVVILSLNPIEVGRIKPFPTLDSTPVSGYIEFLNWFILSSLNLDNLIGILSSFSIEHNYYGMTNLHKYNVADVCFDLVTESAWVSTGKNHIIEDQEEFIGFCKVLIAHELIQDINDYALFGELLRLLNVSEDIVNYFIKPINMIQSTEALAFRNSIYAKFVRDRFEYGMEAIDDTESTTNEEDVNSDDSKEDEGEDTSDSEEDDVTESDSEENTDSDNQDDVEKTQKQDIHKPSIDPTMMLLEMASPDETLSDYVFRETVSMRIDNFLKNPPENASPNDLLMLKRWRSSWMWLTSISCLKDFLTRLSLRLSNPQFFVIPMRKINEYFF